MTDYYVANHGDDLNDGLSQNTPWQTIGKVNIEFQAGGDIDIGDDIYFNRGDTFSDTHLLIRFGGTVSNEMHIGAYGEGAKPIISNTTNGIVVIRGSIGNLTLEELAIQNVSNQGIMCYDYTAITNITIRNIDLDTCGANGMLLGRIDGYLIEGCTLNACHNTGVAIIGSWNYPICNGVIRNCISHDTTSNDGFTLHRDGAGNDIGPNHLIENCLAYGNGEEGFDIASGNNIQVIDCEAYQNDDLSLIVCHGASNVTIDNFNSHDENRNGIGVIESANVLVKNCLVSNYNKHGFLIYGRSGQEVINATFQNNIVIDSVTSESIITVGAYSGGPFITGLTFQNNTFISHRVGSRLIRYLWDETPANTNSLYENNIWWRMDGNPEPFGSIQSMGDITFSQWQGWYPTESFQDPYGDCSDPSGYEGDIICGDPAYGQDPTCLYECQCSNGVCVWVNLGYSSDCDVTEPCINPPGQHGDIICGDPAYDQDPTYLYECVDGQWVDLGYSSDCDVTEPCINPPGQHGDIICGDPAYDQDPTYLYECVDGQWVDLGYSEDCDIPTPPPSWITPAIILGAIGGATILILILRKHS